MLAAKSANLSLLPVFFSLNKIPIMNPSISLRRMSTAAAVLAALALLFAFLALLSGMGGDVKNSLQLQIFSLLFLQLYHFEITKSMVKKVRKK